MTKSNIVERPTGTYSQNYSRYKGAILQWRQDNPEYVTEYNREYQRKLRKDPVKYEELKMRINTRSYLQNKWKTSYKASSAIGMTRSEMANKYKMTEPEFIDMVAAHEIDHIVSNTWFNIEKNKHLKPFMYRHYNLQFIPKKSNRTKHSYIDENDLRVQFVIAQLELDFYNSITVYDKKSMAMIQHLSKKASKLRTKLNKIYK